MNLFVASFSRVSPNGNFETNKNGQLPFIGSIKAGVATASIIDGTIFQRENLVEGRLYLCQNNKTTYQDANGVDQEGTEVEIISKDGVTTLEFLTLQKELGKGVLVQAARSESTASTPPVVVAELEGEVV